MRRIVTWLAATAAVGLVAGPALAADPPKGEITVWSWNVAAEALDMLVPDFNKKYPDVKVKVVNMGHPDVRTKALAGCAAGGTDMPDVVTIENDEAEIYWAQFPDCFVNLKTLGIDKYKDAFPAFKWTALSAADAIYSMPWDSGPTVLYYRRDIYEKAGVDPAKIVTWDDFIDAGKKILAVTNGATKMATMDIAGDDGWFRTLANQENCSYFDNKGETVTINQKGCVDALENLKKLIDAGIIAIGGWGEQIQFIKSDAVASALYGGWYEGTIRSNAPEQSGKWGVTLMPAVPGAKRAANWGGSSLAMTSSSKNQEAAWAYIQYALATNEGQISMLRNRGLVPSLLSAVEDPYVKAPQPYWGNQPIWAEVLGTMKDVNPYRGTQFYADVRATIVVKTINDYVNGTFKTAKEALDSAAGQISSATGLPLAQ